MPKLEPYGRRLSYSYALGVFPALKLLESVSFPEELILNTDERKVLDFLLPPSP